MASRNNTDLDVPPTFESDEPASSSSNNVVGLSMDELLGKSLDNTRDEADYAAMYPPTGDWIKEKSWLVDKFVYTQDQQPGDIDPAGRTFLTFEGFPNSRVANGQEYEPKLRLRISPDKRTKQDNPKEVDSAYKLYLEAKEVYLALHGETCKQMAKLVHCLMHDSYAVRTMRGDQGPLIIQVKDKSKVRK